MSLVFGKEFRPGFLLSILVVSALAILIGLGTWQLHRLEWKRNLITEIEQAMSQEPIRIADHLGELENLNFRPVKLEGTYLHEGSFAFGARGRSGVLGSILVMPLLLTNGDVILIERGWMPEDLLPPQVPSGLKVAGEVSIQGIARFRANDIQPAFVPDNRPLDRRFYWYDLITIGANLGYPVLPVVVSQSVQNPNDRLPYVSPAKMDLPNNHLSYALTWYGLAIGLVIVFFVYSTQRAS